MGEFTESQQKGRTAFLGVSFMIMFTAFNSLQNIVSKIYNDYGYKNLGTASVLLLYAVYGVFPFVASFIIRQMGYKKAMFFSSLGYAVFEGAGLVIALWEGMPKALGWVFVMIGAVFCGAGAGVIWVAQGSYVSALADDESRTKLFGLFWGIMMSSQILGSILTTFVLGLIGTTAYFVVLTVLGVASAFLFLLLPDIPEQATDELSVATESKKILTLLKNKDYRYLTLYYYFPGIAIGFYATFLYKLVGYALPQDGRTDEEYAQFLNYRTGYVFLSLGVTQACVGLFMNNFGERFCKFRLAVSGTVIIELAGVVSLLCYFFASYPLCFAIAVLWGASDTFLQTNLGAIISALFPGQVESFSVFRIVFALGAVTTIVLNLALDGVDYWVFLVIVLGVQMTYTLISTRVMELKAKVRSSLLDRDDTQ